jgi:hypothetical protein
MTRTPTGCSMWELRELSLHLHERLPVGGKPLQYLGQRIGSRSIHAFTAAQTLLLPIEIRGQNRVALQGPMKVTLR